MSNNFEEILISNGDYVICWHRNFLGGGDPANGKQHYFHFTESISWLLMSWPRQTQGHSEYIAWYDSIHTSRVNNLLCLSKCCRMTTHRLATQNKSCDESINHYSISQEICTRFCCALLCCGYAIVHNEFTWSIYPYSSGLLCWHWGNR